MKSLNKLFIVIMLLTLMIVAGCAQQVGEGEEIVSTKQVEQGGELSDEQLLQQYPDHLDEALQELDEIE